MQRNILNRLKKIIISFIALIITMQSVCFADFTKEQQTLILGFAKQVASMDTAYTITDSNALAMGYRLKATYGTYSNRGYSGTHIWLCCATWVSTILNKCFNIEISGRDGTDGYALPSGWINPLFKEVSEAELECGDIVLWDSDGTYYAHMGMYLGDGQVTDCSPSNYSGKTQGGVYVRNFWPGAKYLRYAPDATSADGNLVPGGTINSVIQAVKDWVYKEVPFRPENESNIDKDKTFEYQGIAKLESQTTTEAGQGEDSWRFPIISDLLEWILNFICTIIKSVFVGFATLVQVLITFYIDAASGEDVSTRLSDGMMAYFADGGLKEDISNSLTMEKIVYNKVPLLDVDVFNGNVAGGKTLNSSSLVVIIRNVVASLYMAIRKVSIIALLIVLLYYGIKFAISGAAEQKADYKQKLVNWGIAFFIVFGLHYFLIAVMKVNEITVNLLSNVGTNIASEISDGQYYDLANAMRELTYQTGVVKSILSTCLYMAMVYYLVKFLVIYFKRLFVTIILILLAPFMGIKFAVDRLKFKQSSSFVTWAKEYVFSVGTQTIHALVYTIFIGITYKMALEVDAAKMAICILAFMFFRFMTEAEKMLRKFLKLTGGPVSNIIGDAKSTDIKDIIGWTAVARMYKYTKKMAVPDLVKKKYETGKQFMNHHFANEYVKMKRNEYIERYSEAYRPDERGRKVQVVSNIDKQIEDVLKAEFSHKVDKALKGLTTSKAIANSAGRIVIGIPVTIVEDGLATGLVLTGGYTLIKALGAPITGYRTTSEIAKYRAKNGTYQNLQKWMDVNATAKAAEGIRQQYLYTKDDITAENKAQIALLHQAREAEVDMQYEVAKQKEKLLKGADGVESTTKIQNELAKTYTKKLRRSVEEAMKTVDRKDIQKQVKDYMKKNNKYALTMTDFALIAEGLDVQTAKNEAVDGLIDMEGLTENIKKETMARFVSEITEQDGIGNQITLDSEVMDNVENNIKEKIEKTTDEKEKQSMLTAVKCIEDKRHEIEGKEKLNVFSNLNEEEQKKVKGIIEEATDEKAIEKQVTRLNRDQIIDTMKKAVDKEGSIKKEVPTIEIEEFKPIIKQAEKMRDINELARERGEEPIYKDVGQLVENMIKNSSIRLDKETNNVNIRTARTNIDNKENLRKRLEQIDKNNKQD